MTETPQPYGNPYDSPYGDGPTGHSAPPPGSGKRPGTVLWACLLTWVFSTLALVGSVGMWAGLQADRDEFVRQIEEQPGFEDVGVSADSFADVIAGGALVVAVLALLAIVFAVLAFRRSRGGRIGLVVTASVGAVISLGLSLAIVPFLWVIVCVVTIVLLFAGGASAWFARR